LINKGLNDEDTLYYAQKHKGTVPLCLQWRRLSSAVKGFLADSYGIADVNEYNDMLNDSALQEAVVHDLKCHGLM